jgi:hypothetical protein
VVLQHQTRLNIVQYQRTSNKTRKEDIAAVKEVVFLNGSVIQQPEKERQKT